MSGRVIKNMLTILFLFAVMLFVANCEQTFEPLKENDRYFFSIYGYLDATADTQWVRVMPIQEQLYPDGEFPEVTVTLEHLESGEKAVMNDSLFYFGHDIYARNYWSTMPLESAETYRLTAEKTDGNASHATVTLPEDYPAPIIDTREVVLVDVDDGLVDVQSIYIVTPQNSDPRVVSVPNVQSTSSASDGGYEVSISQGTDQRYIDRQITGPYSFYIRQIYVAVAGPDWVDFSVIDDRVIELPDGVSNVNSGLGYLAGIVSKTVPFRSCFDDERRLTPCPTEPRLRNY